MDKVSRADHNATQTSPVWGQWEGCLGPRSFPCKDSHVLWMNVTGPSKVRSRKWRSPQGGGDSTHKNLCLPTQCLPPAVKLQHTCCSLGGPYGFFWATHAFWSPFPQLQMEQRAASKAAGLRRGCVGHKTAGDGPPVHLQPWCGLC